ncbi:kinase-like domain-containing protein [Amylocystis lapponica]|nr:kinase-like domain-containing protein [Amylocystis lapponica]
MLRLPLFQRLPRRLLSRPRHVVLPQLLGRSSFLLGPRRMSSPPKRVTKPPSEDFLKKFDEEPLTYDASYAFGYAPIKLGDRVGPEDRFEVVFKLGWGMFGTIWMVKDHKQDRYLALKVLTSYGTYLVRGQIEGLPTLDEPDILRRISQPTSAPGAPHCLQLIDQFFITKDQNDHLCLLTEVLGLSMDAVQTTITLNGGFPSVLAKLFVHQLCLALDYLHSDCRVVHTDLKPSNMLLSFDKQVTDSLIQACFEERPAHTYPVRNIDGVDTVTVKSQSLPIPSNEVVHPLQYSIKLADFGSAQFLDKRRTDKLQPVRLRAPEVVLGLPWDEKIDIWSVGCIAFEWLVGNPLFRAQGTVQWTEEDDLLGGHLETHNSDHFPPQMVSASTRGAHFLNADGTLRNIPQGMRKQPQQRNRHGGIVHRTMHSFRSQRPSLGIGATGSLDNVFSSLFRLCSCRLTYMVCAFLVWSMHVEGLKMLRSIRGPYHKRDCVLGRPRGLCSWIRIRCAMTQVMVYPGGQCNVQT